MAPGTDKFTIDSPSPVPADAQGHNYLQFRIRRAKEMLWNTAFSVKEIAASLQFENSCHFLKLFKKKTGMSPSQWRHGASPPKKQPCRNREANRGNEQKCFE